MLDRLLKVYGKILVDELEYEIKDNDSFDASNYKASLGTVSNLTYIEDTELLGSKLIEEFFEISTKLGYSCADVLEQKKGSMYNHIAWFLWDYLLIKYKEEVVSYVKEHSELFSIKCRYVLLKNPVRVLEELGDIPFEVWNSANKTEVKVNINTINFKALHKLEKKFTITNASDYNYIVFSAK